MYLLTGYFFSHKCLIYRHFCVVFIIRQVIAQIGYYLFVLSVSSAKVSCTNLTYTMRVRKENEFLRHRVEVTLALCIDKQKICIILG